MANVIKNKIKALFATSLLIVMSSVLADTIITEPSTNTPNNNNGFPPINWISKSNVDMVSIQNSNGHRITILITVNKNTNPNTGAESPGVNIRNCGTTLHINPGGSAICQPQVLTQPVVFSSDSQTDQASGSYQIKT